MEEIRKQIKALETGELACANCKGTAAHFKCGRCAAPYCSRDCQLSHLSAHRVFCDQTVQALSGADSKDLVQKNPTLIQYKAAKWFFNKERISIALLARTLIPPYQYLSQVLIVEVNNCIDCHVGTCLCAEASGPPPGGFHIVAASIVPRNPCGKHKVSRGIEPLIKEGWGFCTLGRLVVLSDPRAKTLFFQWCFTDSPQDPYTSTQLLQAINRDEEYAVPEIDKRFMLPPCGVPITYSGEPSTGQADIQEVVEFGLSGEPSTPAGMAAYRSQHERLKARANMAEPHKCMCASCSNCSRRWWGRLYEGGVGEKARVRVEVRVEVSAAIEVARGPGNWGKRGETAGEKAGEKRGKWSPQLSGMIRRM